MSGDNKSKDRAEQELTKLRETIAAKEQELDGLKPQYEEMKKKEEECTRELALKEQKRKELYAKQGRGSQFTSKEQRDEWIRKELKSLNKQLKDKTEQIDRLTEDLKKDAKRKVELEKRIEEAATEQENFRFDSEAFLSEPIGQRQKNYSSCCACCSFPLQKEFKQKKFFPAGN